MRTIILKVLCWLCVAVMTNVLAFHNKHFHSNSRTKDYYKSYRHRSSSYPYNTNSLYHLNSDEVRLRHSRYPNLNSVMARLDNMQSRTTTITTTSTTTPTPVTTQSPYRYSISNRGDNLFWNNSEDEEDVSNETENDDDWDEDPFQGEMNDIDGDDEDDLDDDVADEKGETDDMSWQAEEATTEAMKQFSDYKIRSRTSPNEIEETSRRKGYPEYSNPKLEANAAIQHALRMNTQSRCREPSPRVVSVQAEHPDPGKSYLPHCTVLHRCAEDTGCCPNQATTCAPKTEVVVQLFFYTTTIGKPGNKIEKLPFTNHTECACLEKLRETTTIENTSPEGSRAYRSHLPAKVIYPTTVPDLPRCKCPEEYTPVLLKNSGCTCDCTDSNMDCGLIKRGNEFFSMKDRMCIQKNECSTPKCEYGPYITSIGRCPRRIEKPEVPVGVH